MILSFKFFVLKGCQTSLSMRILDLVLWILMYPSQILVEIFIDTLLKFVSAMCKASKRTIDSSDGQHLTIHCPESTPITP